MTSPLAVEHNLREFRALKDTFNHLEWWRANGDKVPAFKFVLRAVLANSPNSIPPERMFSVLNSTFDDDQKRALADYIELQFNERSCTAERKVG